MGGIPIQIDQASINWLLHRVEDGLDMGSTLIEVYCLIDFSASMDSRGHRKTGRNPNSIWRVCPWVVPRTSDCLEMGMCPDRI